MTAGLTRVRTFSQDDAHIFTPLEKVESEIFAFLEFLDFVYGAFGFTDVEISLGLRPEKRIGTDEHVGHAARPRSTRPSRRRGGRTSSRRATARSTGRRSTSASRTRSAGRGSSARSSATSRSPRTSTSPTSARTASQHRPVVLHRAILGSLERFLGHPDRAHGRQLPLLDRARAGGRAAGLGPVRREGARASRRACRRRACGSSVDDRNEKLGARSARRRCMKTPCMLVVGEKEAAAGTVAVRLRHGGDAGTMSPRRSSSRPPAGRSRKRAQELTTEVKDR